MKLTIIGLGPGDEKYLSAQSLQLLEGAAGVLTRTLEHPTVKALADRVNFESYDNFYIQYESFDEVYQAIVDDIVSRLENENIVYAVPGNPFLAENTVLMLKEKLGDKIEVVHGTSFIDVLITELGYDLTAGLSVINALELPRLTPNDKAVLLLQTYDNVVAGEVKIWLSQAFKDEQEILIARAIGTAEQEIIAMPLYQLDHYQNYDHLTSILVLPTEQTIRRDFTSLLEIVAHLRSDNGCPWDRVQTHQSVRKNFLEEAYEAAEAIEHEDIYGLEEELGDVLLQVVFHSQIAAENGDFMIEDVIEGVADKLVVRHPHVYGEAVANDAKQALDSWNATKMKLAKQDTIAEVMQKYTRGLPAAFRAQKIANKAKKAEFKWQEGASYLAKVEEELAEVKQEFAANDRERLAEELGDLLYAIITFVNYLDLGAEDLIHSASEKFIARFSKLEAALQEQQKQISDLSESDLIALWKAQK